MRRILQTLKTYSSSFRYFSSSSSNLFRYSTIPYRYSNLTIHHFDFFNGYNHGNKFTNNLTPIQYKFLGYSKTYGEEIKDGDQLGWMELTHWIAQKKTVTIFPLNQQMKSTEYMGPPLLHKNQLLMNDDPIAITYSSKPKQKEEDAFCLGCYTIMFFIVVVVLVDFILAVIQSLFSS